VAGAAGSWRPDCANSLLELAPDSSDGHVQSTCCGHKTIQSYAMKKILFSMVALRLSPMAAPIAAFVVAPAGSVTTFFAA
jgi:hypothetical protein